MNHRLDDNFWSERYLKQTTGWDVGEISSPLKAYIDQLQNKELHILIPGCGNAHEAAYLLAQGFKKVTLVDISEVLTERLKERFAEEIATGQCEIIHADFFELKGQFDLILEQTFFCAIDPAFREKYAETMAGLLKPGGKLAGVLFNVEMPEGPPFGGSTEEYERYFSPYFDFKTFETCYNSITPRAGRELFCILEKKQG